jgi:hypothetical protein
MTPSAKRTVMPHSRAIGRLADIQRAQVDRLLLPLCQVPPHARLLLRKGFRVEGRAVILFESRPRIESPSEWMECPVAKFRYVESTATWRLFCQHRDLNWHRYEPRPESKALADLVDEVRSDPTGIFWG